jgi:hypothetical protein
VSHQDNESGITDAERERLSEILAQNRNNGGRNENQTNWKLRPVTDTETVVVSGLGHRCGHKYHKNTGGHPACTTKGRSDPEAWKTMPNDRIATISRYSACLRCYPDGDDGDHDG